MVEITKLLVKQVKKFKEKFKNNIDVTTSSIEYYV